MVIEMENTKAKKPSRNNGVNKKKCFENFVVGNANRFATAAARAIVSKPGDAYNPLFIYSDSGLGKTHLLYAIGNAILEANPNAKVKYVTGEAFTNDIIKAIKKQKVVDFQEEYLNLDCLMVDDIQFFAGKERTQEEFFHIINALKEKNKQIVIASSCHPQMLGKMEERLLSRLISGLSVDIQPLDLETRIAILRKKAEIDNIDMPDDVIQMLAERIDNNVCLLEGAFNHVAAYAKMMNTPVDMKVVEKVAETLSFYEDR
jgi:chromosomal replication initiator protein